MRKTSDSAAYWKARPFLSVDFRWPNCLSSCYFCILKHLKFREVHYILTDIENIKTIISIMFVRNEMFCTQTVSLLSMGQIEGGHKLVSSDVFLSFVGKLFSSTGCSLGSGVFRCARDPLAETPTVGNRAWALIGYLRYKWSFFQSMNIKFLQPLLHRVIPEWVHFPWKC